MFFYLRKILLWGFLQWENNFVRSEKSMKIRWHSSFKHTWYRATCCCGVNADDITGCGFITGCGLITGCGFITGCCIGCAVGAGLCNVWWTSGWTWTGLGGGCGLPRGLGCGLELMVGGLVVLLSDLVSRTAASGLGGTSYRIYPLIGSIFIYC